jgi:hypothetical protein
MEYTTYRDGGTKKFTCKWFCAYFKLSKPEVCLDHRMNTETYGRWYLKANGGVRDLTQEEKDYVIPEIVKSIEADVLWRTNYLKSIKL